MPAPRVCRWGQDPTDRVAADTNLRGRLGPSRRSLRRLRTCRSRASRPGPGAARHGHDASGTSGAPVQIGYKPHHPTPPNVDQHQPASSQATRRPERRSPGQGSLSGATSASAACTGASWQRSHGDRHESSRMLTERDPYPIHRMFGRRAAAGRAGEAGGTAPAGVPRRATRLPGSGQEARRRGRHSGRARLRSAQSQWGCRQYIANVAIQVLVDVAR
jgi:hypothetical protein